MPAPIPTPLPLWAKAVLQLAPFALGWLYDSLDFEHTDDDPEALTWCRVETVFTRATPAGTAEDVATVGMNIMNITGGAPDPTWTSGDFAALVTPISTYWGSINSNLTNNHTIKEHRLYLRRFNPMTEAKPFAPSGPPAYVMADTRSGTVAATGHALPYQAAMTHTLVTSWPRHWGRFYLPGLDAAALDDKGRIKAANITAVSNAYTTFATSLAAADFFPVVPVTQVEKTPWRGLLTVQGHQVDDIPDVQRRRRARRAAIRTQVSL